MAKGTIGILTGGGDVPGLNPAIRAVTMRAIKEGYDVIGFKNGWKGTVMIDRNLPLEKQTYARKLTLLDVDPIHRTGGTVLHSARLNPVKTKKDMVPKHLQSQYHDEMNDLTPEVLKNFEHLGIEYLIPIGGDDTLSYAAHLHKIGFKCVAIPKTMDNDVPGTDYCLGFSTCLSRTVEMVHQLRTPAGSHERFLVIEVFGRYAGFTALIPTLCGAADRCVIPEHKFNIDRLAQLMVEDKKRHPSGYSVCLVSEGATFEGGEMIFQGGETDGFGHRKLGGIGDQVAEQLKKISAKYNDGEKVEIINQRLGYMVRCGNPDAIDSLVGLAYGNMAAENIISGKSGLLVCLREGRYTSIPLDVVVSYKKLVDVTKFYDVERYRPNFTNFAGRPMWIA
ncbi:MAG: ATP-dependent 6-phosphofructokinase [Bacteriovoracaceae bacterium]|nr:ATP-dependent 6-phosphofructokinase [Bacteriovoracaceae bacterium]